MNNSEAYAGMDEQDSGMERLPYFEVGQYTASLDLLKDFEGLNGPTVVAEFSIKDAKGEKANAAGTRAVIIVVKSGRWGTLKMVKIKKLVGALIGKPTNKVTESELAHASGETNPHEGKMVRIFAYAAENKDGGARIDFSFQPIAVTAPAAATKAAETRV